MTSDSNLKIRNSVYYARQVVPVDLARHFPSRELVKSLNTKDRRTAKVLFASPFFIGCKNDLKWHLPGNHLIRDDHRYWLPHVMMYLRKRPAKGSGKCSTHS